MVENYLKIVGQNKEPVLHGKVTLISGSSSGIGLATSKLLLENGVSIAGTYNKNKSEIDNLAEVYGKERVLSFQIDFLRDDCETKLRNIVAHTKSKFGKIDILINISGVWLVKPFLYESSEEVKRIWRINYWSAYHFMHQVLPHMLQNGGNIINIASVSGLKGTGQEATYGATKAALINLTQSIAEEFAPRNIKVNLISPGATDTSALEDYFDAPMKELLIKHIPLGRLCKPIDVANAVLLILTNDYMTGANIVLHGGRL